MKWLGKCNETLKGKLEAHSSLMLEMGHSRAKECHECNVGERNSLLSIQKLPSLPFTSPEERSVAQLNSQIAISAA